jgi:hypothetical protein
MTNPDKSEEIRKFFESLFSLDSDECILWPFTRNAEGYGIIGSHRNRKRVSREICLRKYGEPPEGKPLALHSVYCISSSCVNPQHLRWGSDRENRNDSMDAGTAHFHFRDGGKNQFFGSENGRWIGVK